MLSSANDMPIAITEAMLLWGKSKKQVYWAIWRDIIKARQSINSQNWMLSYNSCVEAWGKPLAENIIEPILEGWNAS